MNHQGLFALARGSCARGMGFPFPDASLEGCGPGSTALAGEGCAEPPDRNHTAFLQQGPTAASGRARSAGAGAAPGAAGARLAARHSAGRDQPWGRGARGSGAGPGPPRPGAQRGRQRLSLTGLAGLGGTRRARAPREPSILSLSLSSRQAGGSGRTARVPYKGRREAVGQQPTNSGTASLTRDGREGAYGRSYPLEGKEGRTGPRLWRHNRLRRGESGSLRLLPRPPGAARALEVGAGQPVSP